MTTLELEPTPSGTIVHYRFAPPRTARERAILGQMGEAMDGMFKQRGAQLTAHLGAELGALALRPEEPHLPLVRQDGVLASIVSG